MRRDLRPLVLLGFGCLAPLRADSAAQSVLSGQGFRVFTVPEPGVIAIWVLTGIAVAGVIGFLRRRISLS